MTMYLILSAFTSSTISLLATTKASVLFPIEWHKQEKIEVIGAKLVPVLQRPSQTHRDLATI